MKNRSGEKIKLASIDELLGVVNEESAMEIEISKIHPFKNHPFKVLDETGTGDHGTVKGRKSDGMGSENEQYVIVCKGDCGYRDGLSIMEIK